MCTAIVSYTLTEKCAQAHARFELVIWRKLNLNVDRLKLYIDSFSF